MKDPAWAPLKALLDRPKQAIWQLPYPVLLRLILGQYLLTSERAYEKAARQLGLERLPPEEWQQLKKSDTLAVLGSGWSITEIGEARWAQLRRTDRFGFNFWHAHPELPNFYACESMVPGPILDQWVTIAERRSDDYRGVLKLITEVSPQKTEMVERAPQGFRERAFTMPIQPCFARNGEELRHALLFLERKGVFTAMPPRFLKYRATVSMMVTLGAALGHRDIVLCGIDLRDPRYFYQADPALQGLRSSPPGPTHATMVAKPNLMSIVDILAMMNEVVLKPRGVRLWVESATSALHPMLPVWPGPQGA